MKIYFAAILPLAAKIRQNWRQEAAHLPAPARLAAFTLIELSIALVIIGLIAGGVLVGQDLIEAAKMRKVGYDYEKYNTAIITFKLKYNCLPGDCLQASSLGLGTSGDGDKIIDYDGPTGTANALENVYLWKHLENAGLVNGNFSGTANTTCSTNYLCYSVGVNSPQIVEGAATLFLYHPAISSVSGHMMVAGDPINASQPSWAGRWHNPIFTTSQQYGLDKKFDDGKPYTGRIADTSGASASVNCTTSEVVATAEYSMSQTGKKCILVWKAQF